MISAGKLQPATASVLLLLVSLSAAVGISRSLESRPAAGTPDEYLLISSPRLLRRLSLGYSSLLADLYWTRAVQYFGQRHRSREGGYRLLAPILEITTTLDPHLLIAYEYGATFLAQQPPDGAGEPARAAELVRAGIRQNPHSWHLYYTLGFIYGVELKQYRAAAEAFASGAKQPGAYPWMTVMAATMAQHGGEPGTAHYLWTNIYLSNQDKLLRENAYKHLRATEADEDIRQLEAAVEAFRGQTGRPAADLHELLQAGLLLRVPHDPAGHAYQIIRGRVGVENPSELPFLGDSKLP